MAIRRGCSCSFLELVQKQNNNKQKRRQKKKKPCAVEIERSDPPALRTGNDKLKNSFKHVQRSLSGHRQAHRCEKRVKRVMLQKN